jgi:glutamate carboxypeptidase
MKYQLSDETPQNLELYLAENLAHYLDMLRQMVGINSFTLNVPGVDRLGYLTAEMFETLGFTAERVLTENWQFSSHVILTRPGRSRRKIALVSHLDTVYTEMEEHENDFFWREEGDRIYGPGTLDIKGGTVMIYMVLDALQRLTPDLFEDITWVVLLDAAEEMNINLFGAMSRRYLDETTLACLVFEAGRSPTNVRQESAVVVARKGMAVFRLEATGRAAHPGTAFEHGVNAIVHLAGVVQQLAALTDLSRKLTVNVGTINGGTTINRVPHFASIGMELRTFDVTLFENTIERVLSLSGPVQPGPGCIKTELLHKMNPWARNEGSDRLLALWRVAGQSLGRRIEIEERGGLSDGNMLWRLIPTIDGLGPVGANAHCSERSEDGQKDQEYVLRDSFVPLAQLNALAIINLVSGQSES